MHLNPEGVRNHGLSSTFHTNQSQQLVKEKLQESKTENKGLPETRYCFALNVFLFSLINKSCGFFPS